MKYILCLFMLICGYGWADTTSGTLTTVPGDGKPVSDYTGSYAWVKMNWVSTGGTSVLDNTIYLSSAMKLDTAVFVPDLTSAPTNLYDVTIQDSRGIDILCGMGANRSATTAQAVVFGSPVSTTTLAPMTQGTLTTTVTNAGTKKAGAIWLGFTK